MIKRKFHKFDPSTVDVPEAAEPATQISHVSDPAKPAKAPTEAEASLASLAALAGPDVRENAGSTPVEPTNDSQIQDLDGRVQQPSSPFPHTLDPAKPANPANPAADDSTGIQQDKPAGNATEERDTVAPKLTAPEVATVCPSSSEPSVPIDPPIATVTVGLLPESARKGRFKVNLDDVISCDACGARGRVPHANSLVFWQFWSRSVLAALVEQMREGERLNWIAHHLVKLQGPDGERVLQEKDGTWSVDKPSPGGSTPDRPGSDAPDSTDVARGQQDSRAEADSHYPSLRETVEQLWTAIQNRCIDRCTRTHPECCPALEQLIGGYERHYINERLRRGDYAALHRELLAVQRRIGDLAD